MMTRRVFFVIATLAALVLITKLAVLPLGWVSAQDDLPSVARVHNSASIALTVTVAQANHAPILLVTIPLGAETVSEGGHLEYGLAAADPDGTTPALLAGGFPKNAALTDSGNGTGSMRFDPDYDQAGLYSMTVIASDGALADSLQVSLSVTETNRAPVVTAAENLKTREGEHLEFRVIAKDPDGTIPVLSAARLPQNAAIVDSGNGSASVTFDPDYDQAGDHILTIVASDGQMLDSTSVLIAVSEAALPRTFYLGQNYPNPFNSATVIVFNLGETSADTDARVRLEITNILGQRVRTLVDGELGPGPHSYTWDARDNSSQPVASGMYFYQLTARGRTDIRKMMLLK